MAVYLHMQVNDFGDPTPTRKASCSWLDMVDECGLNWTFELVRVNDAYTGRRHRYAYGFTGFNNPQGPGGGNRFGPGGAVVKMDTEANPPAGPPPSSIKPRVKGASVHRAVQEFFQEKGYATERRGGRWTGFFHGTGHGLGLELHEEPRLAATVLRAAQDPATFAAAARALGEIGSSWAQRAEPGDASLPAAAAEALVPAYLRAPAA